MTNRLDFAVIVDAVRFIAVQAKTPSTSTWLAISFTVLRAGRQEQCSTLSRQWKAAAEKLQPLTIPVNPAASLCRKELVTEKRGAPAPLGFVLRGVDSAHPYLATGGIASQTASHFGIGFYAGPGLLTGHLVIPIHDAHGRLVAYCSPSLDGTEPRYRFPPGSPKSEVLFNLHRAAPTGERSVVVV